LNCTVKECSQLKEPASSTAPPPSPRASSRRSLGAAATAAVAATKTKRAANGKSAIPEDVEMADGEASAVPSRLGKRSRGSLASTSSVSRKSSVFQAVVNQTPVIPGQFDYLFTQDANLAEIAKPERQLFVFGTGDNGQLGLGPDETDEVSRPRLNTYMEEKIAEGKLAREGQDKGGFEKIACGGMHTLAVDEAGQVSSRTLSGSSLIHQIWSWGINDNASLGRVTADVPDPANEGAIIPNEDLETYPMVIESLTKQGFRAVEVAAGDSCSVAISDKGELKTWGSFRVSLLRHQTGSLTEQSNDGLLGFDSSSSNAFQFLPKSLDLIEKTQFSQVSCGADHVLALTTGGRVYVWGNGQQNQLGRKVIERRKLNGLTPVRLALKNIVHVSAGMYHSFAVDKSGTVWAWGLNTMKQTGIASERGGGEELVIVPTQVDALYPENHGGAKVVQISGGNNHSLFLFDNGQVWGCGRCDGDELGLASDNPAQEGIKERRQEALEARQAVVAALEAKLAALPADVDAEDKEALESETTTARLSVNLKQSEWVPEPTRVSLSLIHLLTADLLPSSSYC
jgi:regulator of chromosome condensation